MSKMHAGEVDINPLVVKRLIGRQFPEWKDLPIKPVLPWGTDNATYRLGNRLAVRLPRLAVKEPNLIKELTWLPKIAPLLSLDIPVPVAEGVPDESYPYRWGIYKWLEGEPATKDRIADFNQTATDLAKFIADLEQLDTTGGPVPVGDYSRGVPLVQRDKATRVAIGALAGKIDIQASTEIWEAALNAHAWDRPPVWIHGDLDSRNLLARNGRLCGVIDFGSLGIGDPAYDVMVAWKLFTGESRDIFRTKLSVDEDTWIRSRGIALSQAVMILSYYTLESNEVLVREAEHWLSELLASI